MIGFRKYGPCPAMTINSSAPMPHDFAIVKVSDEYRGIHAKPGIDNLTDPYIEATIVCRFCFGSDRVETNPIYPRGE